MLLGELIAVLSGKGGTGKTSLCAGIATALSLSGKKVLCIDCDIGLRNLDISLGLTDSGALSFLDVAERDYPLSKAAKHPQFANLSFLTAPVNCRAEDISPDAFGAMLRQARQQFDYVFLDAPAGIDAGFRLCAAHADRVILVTGPDPAAVRDAARTAQLLEGMKKERIRLIVNRVDGKLFGTMGLTVDDIMDQSGLPLLGIVPNDPEVTLAAAFGKPLLLHSRKSQASAACKRIAQRIQGLPVPISIR